MSDERNGNWRRVVVVIPLMVGDEPCEACEEESKAKAHVKANSRSYTDGWDRIFGGKVQRGEA